MATFNCEATLESALDSIIAQDYPDWELIVCDDGSTDGTFEILERYAATLGPRMIVLRNATNKKLAYSLNRCLEESSGQYIARMDGDDLSEHDRFATQLEFLESHPEVDLVGTAMRRFNERGVIDVLHPRMDEPDRWSLMHGKAFFHATIMARRAVFDGVGGYTVKWRTERGQDLDLWYKFFAAGYRGVNLRQPLYKAREDVRAIRRRTVRSRWGIYLTTILGNRSLGYPPRAYLHATLELMKVFVPSSLFLWHREFARRRWNRGVSKDLSKSRDRIAG